MYDVAVIGAGPAGATCARYLGKQGYDVILIDRTSFPRDKPCGGGFSPSIIDDFSYLKKRREDFLERICRVGVLHSPNRNIQLESNIDMAVALRTKFDFVLVEEAQDCGAVLQESSFVREVRLKSDKVMIGFRDGRELNARCVVGADGVNSTVARSVGLHKRWEPNEITPCRVAEIPMPESKIDDIYTPEGRYHFFANFENLPGYGWIFPKTNTVNVGIGVVGRKSKGLLELFSKFISYLIKVTLLDPSPDLTGARGALVPTCGTINCAITDRCILVGDSAGMVNPLTGGGIGYAMRAGKIGAMVLSRQLERDRLQSKSLEAYERIWRGDFGHEIGPLKLAQRVFTGPLTSVLFEIGSRDKVIQQMVGTMMSETDEASTSIGHLAARALFVCLREPFRMS